MIFEKNSRHLTPINSFPSLSIKVSHSPKKASLQPEQQYLEVKEIFENKKDSLNSLRRQKSHESSCTSCQDSFHRVNQDSTFQKESSSGNIDFSGYLPSLGQDPKDKEGQFDQNSNFSKQKTAKTAIFELDSTNNYPSASDCVIEGPHSTEKVLREKTSNYKSSPSYKVTPSPSLRASYTTGLETQGEDHPTKITKQILKPAESIDNAKEVEIELQDWALIHSPNLKNLESHQPTSLKGSPEPYILKELLEEASTKFSENQSIFNNISNINDKFSWQVRQQLASWILEVGSEFVLRRQTTQFAIFVVDYYLGLEADFPNSQLQLLAATALVIASKFEELHAPSLEDFCYACCGSFSTSEIRALEMKICKRMNWNLNYISHSLIFGALSKAWDGFITSIPEDRLTNLQSVLATSLFRKSTEESYYLFSITNQLLDCLIYHPISLNLNPVLLVLGAMQYSLEGNYTSNQLEGEENNDDFQRQRGSIMASLFIEFLGSLYDFDVSEEVAQVALFLEEFRGVEIDFSPPRAAATKSDHYVHDHYEDFLSLQTFNQQASQFVEEMLDQ